jgi:hypothetical protein
MRSRLLLTSRLPTIPIFRGEPMTQLQGSLTGRAKTRDEVRADEVSSTPALSQGIVARALAGEGSPRQAIKARCLQCSNFQRDEVANCTVIRCALWQFRPYQSNEE